MARALTILCSGLVFLLAGCGNGGNKTCPEPSDTKWPERPAPASDNVTALSWDTAEVMARNTLASMTDCDKALLMQGIKWETHSSPVKGYYVGNTYAIPKLGIPSLNFNDASGGFRTLWEELVGTVTAWPSQLALAATWNPSTVNRFSVALGREFASKGANSVLGPSINVHRVARGGRNFEYLSGEDPYLGAALTREWVRGVQSQGVMAVMKHFVLNNQETNRNTESSNADEVTKWELYYPPFQAAIDAGVSAAMCSYNKEDGIYSCSNKNTLDDLRKMGFKGFVQSDWWATQETSVNAGLDQEMPGTPTEAFFDYKNLKSVAPSAIDASVTRILAAMHRLDLFNRTRCSPPNCDKFIWANVTNAAHAQLAQDIAAESVILLKNNQGLLPLSKSTKSLAVIGPAGNAQPYNPVLPGNVWNKGDYYSGGGSGHITAANITTPLAAILARAKGEGMQVHSYSGTNIKEAVAVAKEADVSIVFAATTSGEAEDRANLTLDHEADALIAAVAEVASSTVVLLEIPGAVLTPWRDEVDAMAAMFLGGQAAGAAWVDVIFGDVAPAGRLPIMLPAKESDQILPGEGDNVAYDEVLRTSYRNKNFSSAFPFGHGLTYTMFTFSNFTGSKCSVGQSNAFCISFRVENQGKFSARAVPQLYLEFPKEANVPAALLKGFQKTELIEPQASIQVTFMLTSKELSYYVPSKGGWVQATTAIAHIGESSADIRGNLTVSLGASVVYF